MTTRRLVVWIAFLAIFAMAIQVSVDTDTWWHLRAGQWIVEHQQVPQVDPFSYTRAGAPWQYPGWLVEAPMYWIYRLAGPGGLNLWTAVMVTLAFAFVWLSLSGGPFLRAFALVGAAVVSAIYWAARPYLVTFLLAAVFLWVLEDFRWRRGNRLWLLPPLMVVWANSHGGFAAGFLLWGVYAAGEVLGPGLEWLAGLRGKDAGGGPRPAAPSARLAWLAGIGLLMVLAVGLNPSGPVMLLYPLKTVEIDALRSYIQEWQPPDFRSLRVQPFAWMLLLTLGAVGASRRRLALTDFLLLAGFAYLGLLAVRNIALFALVAPLILTRHAAAVQERLERVFRRHPQPRAPALPGRSFYALNYALLAVLILAVLFKTLTVLPAQANQREFQKNLPVQAVEFLRKNQPPGRLFNSYNWGGYLLFELPQYPVFVDGRTDLYDDELVAEWLQVMRADGGWPAVLDRWGVRLILVEPETAVVGQLAEHGWRLLYQDNVAVLYGR